MDLFNRVEVVYGGIVDIATHQERDRTMKESVNIYTSTCCGVPANKPAKVRAQQSKKKRGKREEREKAPEFSTLGKWRCGNCGKPCKVSASPRPPKEAASVNAAE